jgi:hypothetical protein
MVAQPVVDIVVTGVADGEPHGAAPMLVQVADDRLPSGGPVVEAGVGGGDLGAAPAEPSGPRFDTARVALRVESLRVPGGLELYSDLVGGAVDHLVGRGGQPFPSCVELLAGVLVPCPRGLLGRVLGGDLRLGSDRPLEQGSEAVQDTFGVRLVVPRLPQLCNDIR